VSLFFLKKSLQPCFGTIVYDIAHHQSITDGVFHEADSTEFLEKEVVAALAMSNRALIENYPYFHFNRKVASNEMVSFRAYEGKLVFFIIFIIFLIFHILVHHGVTPDVDQERMILFFSSYDKNVLSKKPDCNIEQV